MKTQKEAIQWINHHGKMHGRFVHSSKISGDWFVGGASAAEENTPSGHFWELKDDQIRMWEKINTKTTRQGWIVGEWVPIEVLLAGI